MNGYSRLLLFAGLEGGGEVQNGCGCGSEVCEERNRGLNSDQNSWFTSLEKKEK